MKVFASLVFVKATDAVAVYFLSLDRSERCVDCVRRLTQKLSMLINVGKVLCLLSCATVGVVDIVVNCPHHRIT